MNKKASRHEGTEARRGGFTLTELMVAIAVLVGVLLATSKIFSTTSKVTGMGQATANLMQEAAAIERRLRADLAQLSHEGFFAIRCVAVANDVNMPFGYGLLDPTRSRDAIIRADQLVFFTNNIGTVQTYRTGEYVYGNKRGQSVISRIYFGHGFQLGEDALRAEATDPNGDEWVGYDPNQHVFPWTAGAVQMTATKFATPSIAQMYSQSSGGAVAMDLPQLDARQWVLARQQVFLMDDADIDNTTFNTTILSARSLCLSDPDMGVYSPQLRDGRVDAAATELNDLRRTIKYQGAATEQPWYGSGGQYEFVMGRNLLNNVGYVHYPRAERNAPGMHRIDQALTNHVLGTACSSVKIDWTWKTGTGYAWPAGATSATWVVVPTDQEQPWFGMIDYRRGVAPYASFGAPLNRVWYGADTIYPDNIERIPGVAPGTEPVVVYDALFGFNQDRPLVDDPNSMNFGQPDPDLAYTPWPTAIRITLTLHDPKTTLEGGREFQFIIDLPERATRFHQQW